MILLTTDDIALTTAAHVINNSQDRAILKNACIIVDNIDNTGKRLIYNEKLSTYPVGYTVSIQTKRG